MQTNGLIFHFLKYLICIGVEYIPCYETSIQAEYEHVPPVSRQKRKAIQN